MTTIRTKSGFEAAIDESRLDDYRLMKAIRAAQESPVAVVDVVGFVLGDDEQRLVDHLVAAHGRASMEDIQEEIGEIFSQLSDSKKKSSGLP